MLSPKAVTKFKAMYKKIYGEEISDAVAKDRGTRLINFVKILKDAEMKINTKTYEHKTD